MAAPGWAQVTIDDLVPDFTPEEESSLRQAFAQFTAANTVFTSRNTVATGSFSFDNEGGDFSVLNLPLTYTFGSAEDKQRVQLRAAFGHLSARQSNTSFLEIAEEAQAEYPEIFNFNNQADFLKDEATSLSLGAGIIFQPVANLKIQPSFDLTWTHVRREFDYNNFVSALIGLKYDREIFNNSTESISYSPSLSTSYKVDLGGGYWISPSVLYTHIWTEDLWSKSTYAKFSIDSGVLQTQLMANIPLPFTIIAEPTNLRPSVRLTDLHGGVRHSLQETTFFDFGLELASAVNSRYLSEIAIGVSYVTGDSFDGSRTSLAIEW